MKVTQFLDPSKGTNEQVFFTPEELAELVKLHPATIRKLFLDEDGVIRLGHGSNRRKRQYFTLRIPAHVAERVFGRLTVTALAGRGNK